MLPPFRPGQVPFTFGLYDFACPEYLIYTEWYHVWFISLKTVSSSLRNVATYIGISPFLRLNNIPWYVYRVLYLLIHQGVLASLG